MKEKISKNNRKYTMILTQQNFKFLQSQMKQYGFKTMSQTLNHILTIYNFVSDNQENSSEKLDENSSSNNGENFIATQENFENTQENLDQNFSENNAQNSNQNSQENSQSKKEYLSKMPIHDDYFFNHEFRIKLTNDEKDFLEKERISHGLRSITSELRLRIVNSLYSERFVPKIDYVSILQETKLILITCQALDSFIKYRYTDDKSQSEFLLSKINELYSFTKELRDAMLDSNMVTMTTLKRRVEI